MSLNKYLIFECIASLFFLPTFVVTAKMSSEYTVFSISSLENISFAKQSEINTSTVGRSL